MVNDYNDFINRFSVKNIQVNRDCDYRSIASYSRTASYYDDREETIVIEVPRYGFEDLVRLNRNYDRLCDEHRDEVQMRKQYPAIKEAYDKYRMLLELYR